jgi:hypothetical protein
MVHFAHKQFPKPVQQQQLIQEVLTVLLDINETGRCAVQCVSIENAACQTDILLVEYLGQVTPVVAADDRVGDAQATDVALH